MVLKPPEMSGSLWRKCSPRAHQMNNIYQLGTLKKGSLSIQDYFQQAKGLADILSFIGQPLRDSELISS